MTYKILTVDDSRTIRTIVKNAFKPYTCEMYEAENGRDGLALASEIKPDLIILDITMPVMTGIEMLGKLMADETLKHTAVIMLTAESGRDNVMNIVKMGVKDYIVKPFKGEQLIERVQLLLGDLKPHMDVSDSPDDGQSKPLFTVDNDVVIMTLPNKITRNVAAKMEESVKSKVSQMTAAGARKIVIDLSLVANLSMTAVQSVIDLINIFSRAKVLLRLVATQSQSEAMKGFKETSAISIKLSLDAAKTDF